MADIANKTESWNGHTLGEVESHIKSRLNTDESIVGFYTCGTVAETATKVVAASNYVLTDGGSIKIKFTYANSVASPTLNINSTGAKVIVYNGSVASATNTWKAGDVVEFYYDPTYNSNVGAYIGIPTVVATPEEVSQLGQKVKWIQDALYNGYINGGVWTDLNSSNRQHKIINIPPAFVGTKLQIKSSTDKTSLAFLSSYSPEEGEDTGIIDVYTNIPNNATLEYIVPEGTTCIYLLWISGTNRAPAILTISDVNFLVEVKDNIADLDLKGVNDKKALSQQTNSVDVAANLIPLVQYKGYIASNLWTDIDTGIRTYKILSIEGGKQLHIVGGDNTSTYAILSEYNPAEGTNNGIIVGNTNVSADAEKYITIPNNAKYLYLLWESGTNRAPKKCEVDGVDYILGTRGVLEKLSGEEQEDKQYFGDLYDSPEFNWVLGNINNTTGVIDPSTQYRVTSNSIILARRDIFLSIDSGYRFIIGTYSSSGEWSGYSGGWVTQRTIEKGTFYRIMLQKYPEDTSITADISTFSAALHYQGLVQLIESLVLPQADSILVLNPENEVIPKISNLNRRYISYGGSATQYPPVLVLAHFSDIHADNDNLLRIKQFRDKYASYIDDVIQTGDLIGGQFNDGMPMAYAQTTDFLNVIGNHDSMNREGTSPNYNWVLVNQKSVYDLVLAPYISGWGVTQPADAATNGYCYYYKDYSDNAVRLVVLDNMHWDATQKSWFEGVLAAAITAELDVLVAVHYPPFYINQDASNPFAAIDTASDSIVFTNAEAANAVKTFINNGGNFICWLCGHIHQDVMGLGRQSDGFENQLAISIATASVSPASVYSEMERVKGSRTQDCFNIVGIDTHSKTIKVLRVGANYDRYMRRKNTFSWNYETGTMIYVD